VWGAEPIAADSMARSLAAGERVPITPGRTIADGLKPVLVGERTFAIARSHLAGVVTVDDDELASAMIGLLLEGKVLVEPSGAAALAAALRGLPDRPRQPRTIGVILSGGNVAPELLGQLLAAYRGYGQGASAASGATTDGVPVST